MASVKNLKSKNRAWRTVSNDDPVYGLRKEAFASLHAAKIVAPVRRCRIAFVQYLRAWDRAVTSGDFAARYPRASEARWAQALALNGAPQVQALAAAA